MPVEMVRSVDLGAYVRVDLNGAVSLVAHMSHPDFSELRAAQPAALLAVIHPEAVHVLPADE
jgi:hypothetical protein